jgi:hypothetical protein
VDSQIILQNYIKNLTFHISQANIIFIKNVTKHIELSELREDENNFVLTNLTFVNQVVELRKILTFASIQLNLACKNFVLCFIFDYKRE